MIESLLDLRRSEGDLFSAGCFTLDSESTWKVLGRHLLPDPTFSLLKLLQLAPELYADRVQVRSGRSVLSIRFLGCESFTTIEAAKKAPTGCSLLMTGLAGLKQQKPSQLLVEYPRGRGPFESSSENELLISARFSSRRSRLFVKREREVVSKHARCSPIPICLNGRVVSHNGPPDTNYRPGWNSYLPPDTVLAQSSCAQLRGTVYLTIGLNRRSQIFFIDQGILIEQRELLLDVPGIQAIVDCQSLDMDLSGFRLIENSRYERVLTRLNQIAEELRQQVLAGLNKLKAETAPFSLGGKIKWRKRTSGTALGIVGSATALIVFTGDLTLRLFLLGSPLLACASVASASLLGAPVFKPDKQCDRDLREQIRQRLMSSP